MAKVSLIQSSRKDRQGAAPIMIMVSHKSKTAYIPTNISVSTDEFINGKIVGRKDSRSLNNLLDGLFSQVKYTLSSLSISTDISKLDVKELRDRLSPSYDPIIEEEQNRKKNSFVNVYKQFNDTHANKSTRAIYQRTLNAMQDFDPYLDDRTFEDIDGEWINKFKRTREKYENANTISIHLVHIRAVFNYAIYDLEITTHYPFRKKKGVNKVTIDSESSKVIPMPIEHLREIWFAEVEDWQERWVDLAKLVFLLIGINMADLSELTEIDALGYINYRRRKTRDRSRNGAEYHIKVEPEALAIINKYRGIEHLLSHFDERKDYHSASKQMAHAVKCISLPKSPVGGKGNKAELPRHCKQKVTDASRYGYFCLYSLRKAWATIAFNECNIPMEIISMALGHSDGKGMSVTQRYVSFNNKLVDDANRKVIDWVLYKRKGED